MSRHVTRATRLLSGALALALALISSLTCFIGTAQMTAAMPQMSPSPHACCVRTNTECPRSAASVQQHDCCTTQLPSTAAVSTDRLVPPLTIAAVVAFVPPPSAILTSTTELDAHVPKSSSPPTYLFHSVFRI